MRAKLLLIALLLSQVFCATFYISSIGGSDVDGNGSEDKPFQTIAQVYFNTNYDPTEPLELYFYPGVYGGVKNTAFNFTGPLTMNWVQNTSLGEGDSDLVEFDCTAATAVPCFSSNTSITLNGLYSDVSKMSFTDCSTCIFVENIANSDNITSDYVIAVNGVAFYSVELSAITGYCLFSVEINNSYFSNDELASLSSIIISVVDLFTVQNTNLVSVNKDALVLSSVSTATVENCTFTDSFVFISGKNYKDSRVVLESNTFVAGTGFTRSIIGLQTGTFTIKDSRLESAEIGGVQVLNSYTTSLINSTFSSGLSQVGGAGYFTNVATLNITENCQFNTNEAVLYGGAIYLVNSTAYLDATNFTYNVAVDGSGIGCGANASVIYDKTTVLFTGSQGTSENASYIQNTCKVIVETPTVQQLELAPSLEESSMDPGSELPLLSL